MDACTVFIYHKKKTLNGMVRKRRSIENASEEKFPGQLMMSPENQLHGKLVHISVYMTYEPFNWLQLVSIIYHFTAFIACN